MTVLFRNTIDLEETLLLSSFVIILVQFNKIY